MNFKEEINGWYLTLDDGLVQLIQIDFRLGLFLFDASDEAKLYVGQPCRLQNPDGEVPLIPGEPSSLAPILPFFNAKVVGIAIQKTGQLKVEFGNKWNLKVSPDDSYEAWELGCSIGLLFVCSPGGAVSLFSKPQRSVK